jgi:heparanase
LRATDGKLVTSVDEQTMTIPLAGDRYTLTAADLTATKVSLNGTELRAGSDGFVPSLKGDPVKAGTLHLAPASNHLPDDSFRTE